jgi:4-carboxymuconolactone decarboxylase
MITLDDAPEARLNTTPDRFSHRSLDLKSSELATIATLTALRYPPEQLKIHIESALGAGWSPEEIVEVILQVALYAGLAATETGVRAAQAVFHKLELEQGV